MDHMGWFQNLFFSVPRWVSYKIVGHSSSCRTKPFAGVVIKIVSPFRLLCIFLIFWVSFYHELHQEQSIHFHDYVIIVVGVEESSWYANCYNFLHLLSIDSHRHKYRFKRNSQQSAPLLLLLLHVTFGHSHWHTTSPWLCHLASQSG